MLGRVFSALGLIACAAGGCSARTGDAVVDASVPDAICPVPAGRVYIASGVQLLPAGEGYDLDRDGDIDNAFGSLPSYAVANLEEGLNSGIQRGDLLMAVLLARFDPPAADDPDVSLHVLHVFDADMPAVPENNLDGTGMFVLPLDQLQLSCQSDKEADRTIMEGLAITAYNDLWLFPVTTLTGAIELIDAIVVMTLPDDFASGLARLGATMSLCSLSGVPFPGSVPGTLLDVMINDPGIASVVTPDSDLDGDGLEQVVGDGTSVSYCLDGDGLRLEGRDCPCHPRIADGFTMALDFSLVSAQIVGVVQY